MANEVRLIDANALHKILEEAQDGTRRIYSSLVDYRDKEVCKGELGTYARAKRMVEDAPTIDLESLRPKGRWVQRVLTGKQGSATCSECNTTWDAQSNYCPNCGAKMEG